MNERIKELSKQAGFFADQDIDKINKFAMLIIKECMQQVDEQYNPVLDSDEMMKDTHWDGYVHCGIDSVVAIREHFFGVDE
jgi:hypothetical protein